MGLKVLWEEVKQTLGYPHRAMCICMCRKQKEKERAIFKNPFRNSQQLLEDKKSGKLEMTKEELKHHVCDKYSNPTRSTLLGFLGYVPHPAPPTY